MCHDTKEGKNQRTQLKVEERLAGRCRSIGRIRRFDLRGGREGSGVVSEGISTKV